MTAAENAPPGHVPVLRDEAVAALAPRPGARLVDATFGGGGYTAALLAAGATVIALDRDPDAIARGAALLAAHPGRLTLIETPFGDMDAHIDGVVDGVVFDLGVSSFQLDEAERGFSFRADAPLDMRMARSGASAADAVALLPESALADVIYHYGDEPAARRIARVIAMTRAQTPIATTSALADLVETALGGRRGAKIHPATKTFQALRILVNDELGELARGLAAAEALLAPGGRLAVVSFHSLEDRLVKTFLTARAGAEAAGSRHVPPVRTGPAPSFEIAARKAVAPRDAEIAANPRARSAKLRVAVRTAAPAWGPLDADLLPDETRRVCARLLGLGGSGEASA
ncbi:MAG: 16S rRNA (cytosine(1402)-N(4))-methyltransferase RsmH [Alphaproteobacteria bacterium]|nr:16S rRNA (cytosine(1402)-N(4))-methyltransferase RsmH [Alphaproteobacteria bacterium]